MKKLIFTTLSIFAAGSIFAQQKVDNRNDIRFKASNEVQSASQRSMKNFNKDDATY
jgi:hypothetical protein